MAGFGPIEIVVFAVPGETLDQGVLEQVRALVDTGTVRIVDAVLAQRDADGAVAWAELADQGETWNELTALIDHLEGLVATEDLADLTTGLVVGETALVLAFENTWLRPLLAAVRDAGGRVVAEVAVPDDVVQQVADAVPDEN